MGISITTKQDSWLEGSPNRREKTVIKRLLQLPDVSLVASMGWSLHQMDVKTIFLYEVN